MDKAGFQLDTQFITVLWLYLLNCLFCKYFRLVSILLWGVENTSLIANRFSEMVESKNKFSKEKLSGLKIDSCYKAFAFLICKYSDIYQIFQNELQKSAEGGKKRMNNQKEIKTIKSLKPKKKREEKADSKMKENFLISYQPTCTCFLKSSFDATLNCIGCKSQVDKFLYYMVIS